MNPISDSRDPQPANVHEALALSEALGDLLAARGRVLRAPPPVPTSCCGRGCNGCVWEGYFQAHRLWRADARALLESSPPANGEHEPLYCGAPIPITSKALQQHFITDDGERIHLRVSGEGRPMILLHGWTSTHRDWNPFVEAFAAQHRVIRWDARGHGGHTRGSAGAPTLARMARDLDQLMVAWDLQDAVVIGHSMGALTLWQYLRDFGSGRLARAVFIDQSPRLVTDADWALGIYGDFDEDRNQAFIRELGEDFAEGVLRLVARGLNARARRDYELDKGLFQAARERLRTLAPEPLIECWKSLSAADLRPGLGDIDIPCLLVYGSESNFYTAATARYVHERIPGSRLEIYPGLDHSPHMWQPARFIEEVLGFVADGTRRAHEAAA